MNSFDCPGCNSPETHYLGSEETLLYPAGESTFASERQNVHSFICLDCKQKFEETITKPFRRPRPRIAPEDPGSVVFNWLTDRPDPSEREEPKTVGQAIVSRTFRARRED